MSEEEASVEVSVEESDEFEVVDHEIGEGEGTRDISDLLSAIGVNIGGKKQVLRDAEGNPIQPVYAEDGTLETPTLVDADGNVVHQGSRALGTGQKVALGAAGIALLGGAAVATTAVGVHFYRKKAAAGKGGKSGKKSWRRALAI